MLSLPCTCTPIRWGKKRSGLSSVASFSGDSALGCPQEEEEISIVTLIDDLITFFLL